MQVIERSKKHQQRESGKLQSRIPHSPVSAVLVCIGHDLPGVFKVEVFAGPFRAEPAGST